MKPWWLLILFAAPVAAQEYEAFFEEFDVILHQLQVNVQDRDGNPIRNLSKDDFEVFLNGEKQSLESLQEIDLQTAVSGVDEPDAIPQQARRLFVFLFDLRYSTKRGVLASQQAAREFVMSQMQPADLVGVFNYTQLAGVSMVTNFTNDTGQLMSAIDTLGLASAKNVVRGNSGYFMNGLLDDFLGTQGFNEFGQLTGGAGGAQGQGGTFASEHLEEILLLGRSAEKRNYEREVMMFMTSMRKFSDGLRFIRGRKNVLWFSSGFDSESLTGASAAELRQNFEFAATGMLERVSADQLGRGDVQSEARRVVEALQASGSVVFAVDTSQIDGSANDKSGLQALNMFASDTGGQVFQNRNEFEEVISKVQDITNHYYMLGFYPETKKKGEVGQIKIKIKNQRRAKVTATRGLLLDPDFEGMTQIEKNIHISEYIARDQIVRGIPLDVNVLQTPMSNELNKLNVSVALRGDYFTTSGVNRKARDMEIFAIAFERESNRVFDQSHFQFKIDPQQFQPILDKTGVKYFANLFVTPGRYKLKVVVRDLKNGKIGSEIQNLVVEGGEKSLVGPVLLSKERWVTIRMPEEIERRYKAGDLDFSYPFQLGSKSFVPETAAAMPQKDVSKFFYLLDYRFNENDRRIPDVRAMFMAQDGSYIMIPPDACRADVQLDDNAPHMTRVVLTIDTRELDLKAGETYKLMTHFGLKDNQSIRASSDVFIAGL